MKTISGYVRDVLDESEVALSAMQAGFLNLSAYAKTIQGEVSKRARRDVAVGSSSQQFLHLDGLTSFQSGE